MRKAKRLWRVTVVKPRARDGNCWALMIRPPHGLPDAEGNPVRPARRSSGTSNRAEAEARAREVEEELNAPIKLAEPSPELTFLDVFDRYLRFRELDPETAENTYKGLQASRKALEPLLGPVLVAAVGERAVVGAQDELRQRLKPRTVNLYLSHAAQAWRWAKKRELVEQPWPQIKRLKAKAVKKRPFMDSEVAAILDWIEGFAGGRWYALFELLANTSCRISELLHLQGRDVLHAPEPHIFVRHTKTRVPKRVPVLPELLELLPEVGTRDYLWPSRKRPGEPVRPEVIRDALQKAMKATDIADPEWLSLHSFRRGWIATSEREGNPTPVSMQITGHEDRMVFDGYQRGHKGDDLLGAVRKVYEARQRYRRSRRSRQSPPSETPIGSSESDGGPLFQTVGAQDPEQVTTT